MIYVLSDIHGNKKAFTAILEKIQFTDSDELYVLGDVVDRNPFGMELLVDIMRRPNMHMLLGNHEYMMMQALGLDPHGPKQKEAMRLWFHNGGKVTLDAFTTLNNTTQQEVISYLKSLPMEFTLTVNNRDFVLVHATSKKMTQFHELRDDELKKFLVWDRESVRWIPAMGVHENEIVIFGHTPTCNLQNKRPLEIFVEDNIIGIDCGAAYPEIGRLACVRLDDLRVFYSD